MGRRGNFEQEQIDKSRGLSVYKRDDMVQSARYKLTVQEQRAVLYCISQIKAEDTPATEYSFELKDFYAICGIKKDTYTTTKRMLKALSDRSWWVKNKQTKKESLVRWFNTIDCDEGSGTVTFKFHERMQPYLLNLLNQDEFYTCYNIKYILPMASKHSPRLYEILKSYQKNNKQWFFELTELKYLLDCANYERWPDFQRRVLEPAIDEINKYTDLCIAYRDIRKGKKVVRIDFFMDKKTNTELRQADGEILEALDGQLSMFGDPDTETLKNIIANDEEYQFFEARRAARKAEEESLQGIKNWIDRK